MKVKVESTGAAIIQKKPVTLEFERTVSEAHAIIITTDSGTVYRITETEPDVLQIELIDENLHMTLFPVNPNTIEVT